MSGVGEEVLFRAAANWSRGVEAVGGTLTLTRDTLRFVPHAVNVQTDQVVLKVRQINDIFAVKGILGNVVLISAADGTEHRAVLWGRDKLIEAFYGLRGANTQIADGVVSETKLDAASTPGVESATAVAEADPQGSSNPRRAEPLKHVAAVDFVAEASKADEGLPIWVWIAGTAVVGLIAILLFGSEGASCQSVGEHNAEIIVRELGGAARTQFANYVQIEKESCEQRSYSAAQMKCIMNANTPRGVDRCLER